MKSAEIRQNISKMLNQFKGKGVAKSSPKALKQQRQKALAQAFQQE